MSGKSIFVSFTSLIGILCIICVCCCLSIMTMKQFLPEDLPESVENIVDYVPDLSDLSKFKD